MGSGKTTLGRALQESTGLRFIDLDELIEHRLGLTIRQIFDERGEAGFRELERQTLGELCGLQDVIIACGGGTPCFFDNIERMNAAGVAVFLDASEQRLHSRLLQAREKRPLIASMNDDRLRVFISEALAARLPYYTRAAASFPADRLDTAEQIEQSVAEFRLRFISDR